MEFDLQRFDDEQPASAEPQTAETPQEPLPEELSDLDEDIARETMSEWEEMKSEQEPAQEPEQPPTAFTAEDYQAKVNEVERLKAQLAAYQQPQQPPTPPQVVQPPQVKITPEISAKLTEAVRAEAMAMTGFSDDDVESLRYADDDDPRSAQWEQAKLIAQSNILNTIRQAQAFQQQRAQSFLNEHNAAISTYNEFAQKEFAEPDFKAIQQFATNEFFEGLTPNEQKILANSYIRVEHQTASPAEMLVVKNYYERAKAAFRARGNSKKAQPRPAQVNLPRVDQIGGTAGTGEVSIAELEKMLETTDFDQIPENYQKKLLGLT